MRTTKRGGELKVEELLPSNTFLSYGRRGEGGSLSLSCSLSPLVSNVGALQTTRPRQQSDRKVEGSKEVMEVFYVWGRGVVKMI